jgi:hypothetical protein
LGELATGMLVQHASLGIGKVVAIEATAVHVFFPEAEKRYAAKLRWPAARPLLKLEVERNTWLEGLSAFSLDPATGRYALAASWITLDQAIAEFLAAYPQGFSDPAFVGDGTGKRERASRWRAANAEWVEALGGGEGERLLAGGEIRELVRRALKVGRHVTLVPGALEEGSLADAFRDLDAARAFFEALFEVLPAPLPARGRFEALFAAAEGLQVAPALAWPIATLFPFVAAPERHVFLLPGSAPRAADRLGCDLRFDPAPNWATYAALRGFTVKLLEGLQGIGARDFIDLEAFLYATATKRPPAKKSLRPEASPRVRPSADAKAMPAAGGAAVSRRKR